AEKAPGTPQITRQRIGEDPPALVIASDMASYIAKVSAFFLSGRFIRMVRIGPSSVTMTSVVMVPLFSAVIPGEAEGRDPGPISQQNRRRRYRGPGSRIAPRCLAGMTAK